jgi:hypothetical protein
MGQVVCFQQPKWSYPSSVEKTDAPVERLAFAPQGAPCAKETMKTHISSSRS